MNGTGDGGSTKAKRSRDRTLVGLIVVIGFIGFCFTLAIDPGVAATMDKVILGAILGALGNNAANVVSFYFGSSSGSEDKGETAAKTAEVLAEKTPAIVVPPVTDTVAAKTAETAAATAQTAQSTAAVAVEVAKGPDHE